MLQNSSRAPEAVPEFSLLGGPLHRLARRLGRAVFALSAVFSASFAEDVRFSGVSLDALVLPVDAKPRPTEDLLATPDLQALADLGKSLEVERGMRIVPFGLSLVSA
jgi:hypothetical protein